MKIEIRPSLFLVDEALKSHSLVRGLQLLACIEKEGNLQAGSNALGISYRHAWNTLSEMEELLGGPVVEMTRGRGSELTTLGKKLVGAEKLIRARVGTLLDSMASEIESEIQSAVSHVGNVLKIHASHGFAIETLNKQLHKREIPIDLSYRGSLEALNAFSRGNCDIAGFHVPIGALEPSVFSQFERFLLPQHQIICLATRRQGIMVAKGNPKNIWNIADLVRPDVQFVNRQQGSGTRMILDLLLEQEGISGRDINGYENIELTHAAVAAYILCGKADAGLGVETAARQFDLEFIPLLSERYLLVCDRKLLEDPRFVPVMKLMQTSEFRMEVNKLPGYDAADTGKLMSIADAFPLSAGEAAKKKS
ncbi:substrate-binding domain-containing protein [Oxalobacteraceae bacterium R-40]|uniref:Substrate-binding domain-containing protein n=1 Tax=Keguizhuia sedimenti TaxID=3064264 RepID=A0ABU1BJF3_9BURK|nr:substrate-binding domain-containing protein [Oxalobacteraceae bacterium R-40]